jgi:NodT family efflux transporter outer membrane factor (OMF) lipoprotein
VSRIHFFLFVASTLIAGCAVGPKYESAQPQTAPAWQAALPQTDPAADLKQWWQQFNDPVLAGMIDAAQAGSPTLAQAAARIAQARAQVASSRGGLWPSVDVNARASRGDTTGQTLTSTNASVDALWEIDLWGANARTLTAARAREQARGADWHGARVSLAAEVADTYTAYRACEQLAQVLTEDSASREQSAKIVGLRANAGFDPPADARLAQASAADARQRLIAQRAECDLNVKALVMLTGLAEPELRKQLVTAAKLPEPSRFAVQSVTAQLIVQRPDIISRERELAAASEEIGIAQASRLPRISLLGSIGVAGVRVSGSTNDQSTWSFGPSLVLPLFDAGRRKAGVDAAQARFDEARAGYEQSVRMAVREVEEALVRLDSATRRQADAQAASRDYDAFFSATESRFKAGSVGVLDLEDARRTQLAARQSLIGVQRERVAAWISLYKAVGGGWSDDDLPKLSKARNN